MKQLLLSSFWSFPPHHPEELSYDPPFPPFISLPSALVIHSLLWNQLLTLVFVDSISLFLWCSSSCPMVMTMIKLMMIITWMMNGTKGCLESGTQYKLGEQMSSNKTCQNCYCSYGGVKKCRRIQCSPVMDGCQPITPDGFCCPTEYKCNSQYTSSLHTLITLTQLIQTSP